MQVQPHNLISMYWRFFDLCLQYGQLIHNMDK